MELPDQRDLYFGDIFLIKLESIIPLFRKGTPASHTFNTVSGNIFFAGGVDLSNLHSPYSAPGTILSSLQILTYLILVTTLLGVY